MQNAGEVLRNFYAAVVTGDLAAARACLDDEMVFEGLFETYRSAEEYLKTLRGLLQITLRLEVKKIIGEANDAAVFSELEPRSPAEATVLVAEWHQVRNGKIYHAQSAFDGRPYAAMFAGPRTGAADCASS